MVVKLADNTGHATSWAPTIAAFAGDNPSSIRRKTFSITTIASSTTIPMTSISPNNVEALILEPISLSIQSAPRIAVGIPRAAKKAFRLPMKSHKKTTTKTKPNKALFCKIPNRSLRRTDESLTSEILVSGGSSIGVSLDDVF